MSTPHTWIIYVEKWMHWLPFSWLWFLYGRSQWSWNHTSNGSLSSLVCSSMSYKSHTTRLFHSTPLSCFSPQGSYDIGKKTLLIVRNHRNKKLSRNSLLMSYSYLAGDISVCDKRLARSILVFSETHISIQNSTRLTSPAARGIISREHKPLSVKRDFRIEHH